MRSFDGSSTRRGFLRATGAATLALASARSSEAAAELLSSRPITIVVPYPPGASADATMRLVSKKVTEATGQAFVIEPRGGGGGVPAAIAVKRAEPDGHTLFQANLAHVLLRAMRADLQFDLTTDFQAVASLWSFPYLLVVPAASPAASVRELLDLAKSRPGGLNYATPGVGSPPHLLPEMIKVKTGAGMVHVPYQGAAPALIDLMAGRVDLMFVSYASVGSLVEEGKLRILAAASAQRLRELPNVPTMGEAGLPGMDITAWFGLFAPAQTPPTVIAKLNEAFSRAVEAQDIAQHMHKLGLATATRSAADFQALVASDAKLIGEQVKAAGMVAR